MKLFSLIKDYIGGGFNLQITPNTPKELKFGDVTLRFKDLWGRVNVSGDKAVLEFDTIKPFPEYEKTVIGIPISGTIKSFEITDESVSAVTSHGTHQVYP